MRRAEVGHEAAIRAVWDGASEALCQGDWPRYERLWARGEEVELLHPAAPERLVGSDSILASYRRLIDSGFRCSYRTERFAARLSESGDTAWASVEGVLSLPGQAGPEQRTWYTLVFTRSAGTWRLVHAHASAVGDQ